MSKLHELIAVEPDLKLEATRVSGEVSNLFANGTGRLIGQVRKYRSLTDEGEQLPTEVVELGTTVKDEFTKLEDAYSRWLDVTVQKEVTNGHTTADVMVDNVVVLKALPAPALLNLEAKLAALRAVYAATPTNDPSERWDYDAQQNVYVSQPRDAYRTKKVPRVIVKYPATVEHPAQTEMYVEDVREGVWTTTKRSGMLTPVEKRTLLERVDSLLRAVKTARQRANDTDIVPVTVAKAIFAYLHS